MRLKKALCMALCALMLVSLLPVGALAAEEHCEHHPADHVCGANCDYVCDICVAEIRAMVDALPDMTAITDETKAEVAEQLSAIDGRKALVSDAARDKIDFTKYGEAAFAMNTPENFFGFLMTKRYQTGSGPEAVFSFLDGNGETVKLISADGVELSETEPLSSGGSAYYYLPAGSYSVEERVAGKWALTLNANGAQVNALSGEAGDVYRVLAINASIPFEVDGLRYLCFGTDAIVSAVVGDFEETIPVPLEVEYDGETFTVRGFEHGVFEDYEDFTLVYAGTQKQWDENIGDDVTAETLGVAEITYHEHDWLFTAEGAVITAVCGDEACPEKEEEEAVKATITLKAPADLTYDGSEKSCTVVQSEEDLFDLSAVAVEYSATPIGVGDYTAGLTYEGATANISFSIAAIDISGRSIGAFSDYTYTGEAITPSVALDGLTEGADYTVTYADNTNAGTAKVTVSGIGNYSGSITGTFTIKPADITITAQLAKDAYDYSGSVVEPEVTVTANFGGVDMNLAEGMDYTVAYGQETAAESIVPVTVKPVAGGNFNFAEVTLYYSIGQAIPAYTVPQGLTATYGQQLFAVTLPEAENGSWSWRAPTSSVGAVGNRSHSAIFTPNDSNYKTEYVDVTVTVQPAVITITGVNITGKTYDGSDQVAVSSLVVNGRVGADDVTIANLSTLKATAPSANAGNYTEVTLPTLSLTGADAGNYSLTQPGKLTASYTISPKAVTPVVEVAAGNYVYKGVAHTPAVTLKDGSAVIPAAEYSLRYDCNVNAGIGRVYVSDVAGGNFALNSAEGTFTIQQALITITADNKTATVGQTAPTPTYTTSGVVAGEVFVVLPIVEYVTKPDMSKAGTTVIRASSAVPPSANYTIKYVDGTLTVTAAATGGVSTVAVTVDMSGVKLESKTYDGKPLSFSGSASGRYYYGDFTYTWYTANGYRLSEAPSDAGDYVLRATVSRSGYSGYASKNVSIRKATLTITANDISARVGDAVPTPDYSVKGLAAGDKLKTEPKLSFETEPDMSKAGKTPILVSGAAVPDSMNYETTIKYIEGTLIVNKAESAAENTASGSETAPETTPAPLLKLEVSVGVEDKALDKELDSKESAFYDLELQSSEDGGESWNASTGQLPEDGVKVSLPLPEGSDETCSFRVIHDGGEYPVTVSKHEDGKYYLDFTASELGTVAVGWTKPGKEGGFPWWILLTGLGLGGAALGGAYVLNRRRRGY